MNQVLDASVSRDLDSPPSPSIGAEDLTRQAAAFKNSARSGRTISVSGSSQFVSNWGDCVDIKSNQVDPAALMIAVVVVAAGPLLTKGNWAYLSTVVASVVLVIVVAFSITPETRQSLKGPQLFAISLVIGLIFTVAVSWPIQLLVGDPDTATAIDFGPGVLAAALYYWWYPLDDEHQERWRRRWRKRDPRSYKAQEKTSGLGWPTLPPSSR